MLQTILSQIRAEKWRKNVDAFTLIYLHLKKEQDLYRPHYALLGKKGRVAIFERYDIATNLQLTQLWQCNKEVSVDA